MIALLLLAVVELPLGNFARPGVPVLITSDKPVVVDVGGWKWLVDGPTEIYPPALPATIRFDGGQLQLKRVPKTMILIGDERSMRLVRGMGWQPLDLFDRIDRLVEPEQWERAILDDWIRAGGWLLLGTGTAPPPRWGEESSSVLPEIYDLAPARGVGSRAHDLAKPFAAGTAIVLAVLLLLRPRRVVPLCLLVAALGGTVGAWRASAAVEPFSRAEVRIYDEGRVRVFTMYRAEIDGAEMPAPNGAPFFYRGPGQPWWDSEDRVLRAVRGVIRGFVRDELSNAPKPMESGEDRRVLKPIFRKHAKGRKVRWRWGFEAFQCGVEQVRPLLVVDIGPVR
jgi:hypothetical protein